MRLEQSLYYLRERGDDADPEFRHARHRLLNDDRADHPWMNRTGEVIGSGLVELEREALIRVHGARFEQSRIAQYRMGLLIHVSPGHRGSCSNRGSGR